MPHSAALAAPPLVLPPTVTSQPRRAPFNPTWRLTLREWCALVGADNALRVAQAAGTTKLYLRQLAMRHKVPSYKLAKTLVQLSEQMTPGFSPDLELMLQPLEPRDAPERWWQPQPSVLYQAHQRYLAKLGQHKSAQPDARAVKERT